MNYIYRTSDGICVTPSRRPTVEEVWEFAIKWLRPASINDDTEAERIVRANGEVVEDEV